MMLRTYSVEKIAKIPRKYSINTIITRDR